MITLEQAKALVEGQLGIQMAKFPVRFRKPTCFGLPPSKAQPTVINNGTVALLSVQDKFLAVTCHHVINGYRQRRADDQNCFFAIGNCYFNPLPQIIAEDIAIDVAVIQITNEQAARIKQSNIGIGNNFYSINSWPPTPVAVGDFVAYAGFPGDLREYLSFDEISFGSYSSGACRVTDQHADYLTCEFEREH